MASFNGKAFEKKLKEMDASQTSIQTVSLWIIHHRQVGKQIVNAWANFMKKSKPDRRLLLLYLANDVVQNGRKKAKELIQLFGKGVKDCMQLLSDPKIKQSVLRVLSIWEDRKIYDKDFVGKLKTVLEGNKKPKVTKTIPPDYKLSKVINGIRNMKELENSISKKNSHLSLLKVDASDLEAVKQVKDRFGVDKFCKEFEESKTKLEDYCNTLSRCLNDKRVLVGTLQGCDAFYEAASEEAKIIVNAYKTFGNRLVSMKKKLGSKIKRLEEKKKREELQAENGSESTETDKDPIKKEEEGDGSEKSEKEKTESQDISTPVTSETPEEQSTTPATTEEEGETNKKIVVVDNTKVEDMELDSESDGEVSSGDGPLYDPTSAGQGLEGLMKGRVDFDDVLEFHGAHDSESNALEDVGFTETPPVRESKGFPIMDNLPGISALQTGMVSALHTAKTSQTPDSSPSTDFAPSPEGTPEDLVLREDDPILQVGMHSQSHMQPPLQFDTPLKQNSSMMSYPQSQPTLPTSPGIHSSLLPNILTATGQDVDKHLNVSVGLGPPTGIPTAAPTQSIMSTGLVSNFQGTIGLESLVAVTKPDLFEDGMTNYPTTRSWVKNAPSTKDVYSSQPLDPLNFAHKSTLNKYSKLEFPGQTPTVQGGVMQRDQNLNILKSEALLAEAENAPSPSPSGGSTPTQDERVELPAVRPMDVLTQLINRARGIPDSNDVLEHAPFPPSNPLLGLAANLLGGDGNMNTLPPQGPSMNQPPIVSPAVPTPMPPATIPPSFPVETAGSSFLKGYDGGLLKNEPFSEFTSSLGAVGGLQPFRDSMDVNKVNMPPDDRSLSFPNFPLFEQIKIVKAQGPNGVFVDDDPIMKRQLPILDGNEQRLGNDSVSLSPRTQFLQGAALDFEDSLSSDEDVAKHHRSRKRSSRSRDRSPKYRDRSPKHRDSLSKHKEKSTKHRDRSPRHRDKDRSPKRRERHHSPRQKDRSPKHSSKRRRHSSSKGRESFSPERDKHSGSRRRERSSSLDRSRSSTEDPFYNDRRSPTPELDSLPLGAPLSPRNVRSFEPMPDGQNRELPLPTSQMPIFSPTQEFLLPSPSIAPPFTQPFPTLTSSLPIVTPPRPSFLLGTDINTNPTLVETAMTVKPPLEPSANIHTALPPVVEQQHPSPVSFHRNSLDIPLQQQGQLHPEKREPQTLANPDTILPPPARVGEDRGSVSAESNNFYRDPHSQFQERHNQAADGLGRPFFTSPHEERSHLPVEEQPPRPSHLVSEPPGLHFRGQERPEERHMTEEHQRRVVGPPPEKLFDAPVHRIEEPRERLFRSTSSEERHEIHLQQHDDFNDRKFRFPLSSPEGHRPHFEERFNPPFQHQRDHGNFRDLGFRPNDRVEPQFRPRDDFHRPHGPGYRKPPMHRFQGPPFQPRSPRFPPQRFERPPFPQGPPRHYAPRGPVY